MSTTMQNTHIRFGSEGEAEAAADAAFRQIEEPEQQPAPSPLVDHDDEACGEEGGDHGDAMEVTEEELNDPANQAGIEKSLYFKELSLRAKHAGELANMFGDHQAEVAAKAKKPADAAEGEEPAEKGDTKKYQLALKEQGRQDERLKAYRTKFAKNKILAKRKREARFSKLKAKNSEEKDLEKAIAKSVRAAAKKQQDLAHKAAMAAVRELEAGIGEEAIKEAAMKAYAQALKDAALAEA